MAPKKFIIPRVFNWLLPGQGVVAAVAIYSTIYVFGVGTIPMILAVVAAGIHFLLGLYFCLTQSLPGHYHKIIVPIFLIAGAGVWAACLYYFAKQVDLLLTYPSLARVWEKTEQPLTATWSKVGLATAALNVFIDCALLVIFILSILDQRPSKQSVLPTISAPQQQSYYSTHHQFTTPVSLPQHHGVIPPVPPIPSMYYSVPSVSVTPSSPPPVSTQNRIDTIRQLCALQHPADGSWSYSAELTQLLKICGISPSSPAAQPHEVTTLTHACLSDLLHQVYTAAVQQQQQHTKTNPERQLTPAELASLQDINWDMGWAKLSVERAGSWLNNSAGVGIGR
ncbi:hypothetical protein QBC40DRAFT_273494 [Triangularia verruculosa]|uniref:Uncharacterized protein n=1 Tax=Triangularia verruculosa TaxID=2587418 RepID=A0AAN7B0Q0_9PEZI|nr:hypothetical protein QBC40DRAFT_273494 [Triangularia verruculosa]